MTPEEVEARHKRVDCLLALTAKYLALIEARFNKADDLIDPIKADIEELKERLRKHGA